MMENTVSLETLKVENYSMESGLTPVNRRTVDKMFHYIHSFPLDEYDVELIRKDIIGMAMEGEQRNEPLHICLLYTSSFISCKIARNVTTICVLELCLFSSSRKLNLP